jgi:hypothetical protein
VTVDDLARDAPSVADAAAVTSAGGRPGTVKKMDVLKALAISSSAITDIASSASTPLVAIS